MDDSAFYYLLNKICSKIEKSNTVMRDAVSAEENYLLGREKDYAKRKHYFSNWKELRRLIC